MFIIDYYVDLIAEGTRGAYIALGIACVLIFVVLIQSLLGFSRGTSRSLMRLITVAVSAVAAYFGACILGRAFVGDRTFSSVFPMKNAAHAPLAEAPLAAIVVPILFLVLFFLFSLLMLIPHKLICGIFGFSYERNNLFTRIFGAIVGAAHGAATALIFLFPLFCLMSPYVEAAKAPDASADEIAFYESYVEDTAESPLYKYPMQFGDQVLDEFSRCNKSTLSEKE